MISDTLAASLGHNERVQNAVIADMDRSWPVECSLIDWLHDSILHYYPRLFLGLFGALPDEQIEALSLACRFLGSSAVVSDELIDEEDNLPKPALVLLRVQALQFEAQIGLSALISSLAFWYEVRRLFSQYAIAVCKQVAYQTGRGLESLTLQDADAMAIGKACLSRIPLLALSHLGGLAAHDDQFAAIDAFNLARQIYDDVVDWRADLGSGRPTTLVSELISGWGSRVQDKAWIASREPALAVYYGGIADGQLSRIPRLLEQAVAPFQGTCEGWRRVVQSLLTASESLRSDIATIAARKMGRIRHDMV